MAFFLLFYCRYAESDQALYDKCLRESVEKAKAREAERAAAALKWKEILAAAAAKGVVPVNDN